MRGDGQVTSKEKEKALPNVSAPDTDMIGSFENVEIPQTASNSYGIRGLSKSSPTEPRQSKNAPKNAVPKPTLQPKATTKAECPPELRPILEAKELS